MSTEGLKIRVIPREREGYVSATSFVAIVQNTLAILREVDAEISEQRLGSLEWHIKEISYNSPLTMTLIGEPKAEDLDYEIDIIEAYTEGLRQIDASPDRVPEFFTYQALKSAKSLVSVLNNGVERVVFSAPTGEEVAPTQRVAANVDDLTRTYEELTSFEGKLESATIHGKNRFYVWDVFDGRISCRFSRDKLDDVRNLFGHRVSVYGRARFSRTGRPLGIEVIDLKQLRNQDELPQARDLAGINITGELSSEDYVRRLRDAE
jgi:hypothetical protein